MKKLDLYISKKFIGTFIFMMLIVMSIAVVIDISERIRDFSKSDNGMTIGKALLEYYPYFFIHYVNLFSSLIIFISVLFFTSIMAQRSEIIAILSNGVSFGRFARPYFMVSTLLLVLTLFSNHYWVPMANKKRTEFENKYIWEHSHLENVNLILNDSTIVFYSKYLPQDKQVQKFWIEKWHDGNRGFKEMYSDTHIELAKEDSLTGKWSLSKVFIRDIDSIGERIQQFNKLDTVLPVRSEDLGFVNNALEAMTTQELKEFRNNELKRGSNCITQIEIVLYERTSLPFAAYILTLMGLAVGSRKSREGVGLSIMIGLVLCFLYIFFMKVTTVAATNAGLQPIYAVWVPNIVFAIFGILLYWDRIRHEEPLNLKRLFLPWKWFG